MTKLSTKSTKNEIGFSVVSDSLHAQLFPNYERTELLFNGEVAMVERWLAGGPLTLDN